jgi:hypothetical protein
MVMTWRKLASCFAWFAAGVAITLVVQSILGFRDHALQVQNLIKGRAYVEALEKYRTARRTYPPRLDLALPRDRHWLNGRDAWGTPMVYESDGRRFILISFGADRRRDYYGNFMDLRLPEVTPMKTPFPFWSTCRNPDADQVMSDAGEHRICGK